MVIMVFFDRKRLGDQGETDVSREFLSTVPGRFRLLKSTKLCSKDSCLFSIKLSIALLIFLKRGKETSSQNS